MRTQRSVLQQKLVSLIYAVNGALDLGCITQIVPYFFIFLNLFSLDILLYDFLTIIFGKQVNLKFLFQHVHSKVYICVTDFCHISDRFTSVLGAAVMPRRSAYDLASVARIKMVPLCVSDWDEEKKKADRSGWRYEKLPLLSYQLF